MDIVCNGEVVDEEVEDVVATQDECVDIVCNDDVVDEEVEDVMMML